MSTGAPRLSGLQKDVLSLYRSLLRAAHKKKDSEQLVKFVQKKFREDAKSVKKLDFQTIEHMVRQGQKQKKLIDMPGFSGVSVHNMNK